MTPDVVVNIGQEALLVLLAICAPLLISVLAVGLAVGMFQAATQINEMTLSFIPKIIVIVIALFATGPWILSTLIEYTRGLVQRIPGLIG